MSETGRIAYFDCASGASGEMFLGALVGAGLLEADLRDIVEPLRGAGAAFDLVVEPVRKGPVAATAVRITGQAPDVDAHLSDMTTLIADAHIPPRVADRATGVLRRLAAAEGRVAGERPEDHVFRGTRGMNAVVGSVGVVGALQLLGVREVMASPVNVGTPLPVVTALLGRAPTYSDSPGIPLVMPLGAALIAELVDEWSSSPPFAGGDIGHGAGERDLPKPNVMRCFLGYGTISGATHGIRPE